MKITLPVTIRSATPADLVDLEWYGHQARLRTHMRSILERRAVGETELLVAEANGYAVARLGLDFVRVPDAGLIWSFAVIPNLQRLGIGTALIGRAEELIRARGFETAEIHVEKSNPGALRLYERLAYAVVGEDPAAPRSAPEWVLRKTV